jgi:hypothetical protein
MIKVIKVGEAIELIPYDAKMAVTLENREQFIELTNKKDI